VASWLFFRVAHSARINSDMGASLLPVRLGPSSTIYMWAAKAPNSWRKMVLDGRFVTASPARTALKNSQLTYGDVTIICETVH
jgi:hypothetical protein